MSVDILYSLGDDSLANLFNCVIPPFPGILDLVGTQLRIQNFSIPETGVSEYEVHYKTQKITKPGGKIEDPKEFSFDFRVDKYWLVYKGFKNWKNIIASTRFGTMAPDIGIGGIGTIRTPITVLSCDALNLPTGGLWVFEGSWIKKLGEVGFDYTSGDPITVSVTFGYLALNDIF